MIHSTRSSIVFFKGEQVALLRFSLQTNNKKRRWVAVVVGAMQAKTNWILKYARKGGLPCQGCRSSPGVVLAGEKKS